MTKVCDDQVGFFKVYDTRPKIALRGWSMKPSRCKQEPISLYFEVPKDFNHRGKVELDLHILVQRQHKHPVKDKDLKIRVRSDSAGNDQDLGCEFNDCVEVCCSIDEPGHDKDCDKLRHFRVKVCLDPKHIEGQDLVVLVIDRGECHEDCDTTKCDNEYDDDVFLVGASFRYKRKCH